jgi:hypothetical protein
MTERRPVYCNVVGSYQQAQELILGPSPTTKTRLLSCDRTESRVITGLLTVCNAPRKHLYLMGMINSPLCRCGADDETSAHILCECEVLALLLHAYLSSYFLDPEDLQILSLGAGTGLP